jgi:hypothetical protein
LAPANAFHASLVATMVPEASKTATCAERPSRTERAKRSEGRDVSSGVRNRGSSSAAGSGPLS